MAASPLPHSTSGTSCYGCEFASHPGQRLDVAIRDREVPQAALSLTREVALETYEVLLEQFGKKGDLYYIINIKNGSCSCPDRCRRHMVCKHLFAVFRHHPQWSFSDLPTSFTGAATMILDAHVTPELNAVLGRMAAPPLPATVPTHMARVQQQPRVSAERQQLVDVLSTLTAASYLVEEEGLPGFLAGARQLQQQYVRPSDLFVKGVAPPRGSRAAAANHLGARKKASRTGQPLQVSKSKVTKRSQKGGPKPTDFPKRKKTEKQKPFESMTGMTAALNPPFQGMTWVGGELEKGPRIGQVHRSPGQGTRQG